MAWRHGGMATRRHGDTAAWRHGGMATRRHGDTTDSRDNIIAKFSKLKNRWNIIFFEHENDTSH
jgi:hypothetical protein